MKKIFLAIFIILFIIVLLPFATTRKINAKVYSITENIVIFEDICGNLWAWNDKDEIFLENQEVTLYINDKITDFLEDDEIIKVRKVGKQNDIKHG